MKLSDLSIQRPVLASMVSLHWCCSGPLGGSTFVWVAARAKATRRQVELGVRTPGFVEVKSGIDSGETVVVGGQERLGEGAPVAPKLIQRAPARGGEESASVEAR